MTGVERAYRYCEDVEKGKIRTNLFVKQAVKRFRKDLKRAESPDCPFIFDENKANHFIQFAECLKLYKDEFKGKPMIMNNWSCFFFCNIYGFVDRNTGYRRFRKAFLFVGRKQAKSHMAAAVALYDLLTTNGSEVDIAATKREQAKIVYDVCVNMIRQNPELSRRLTIYNSTYRITNPIKAGFIEAIASNSNKADGKNSSTIIADEVSSMEDYGIIKVLQSGQGARPEGLLLEITSGSDNMESPGRTEWERSRDILSGAIEDDSFLCLVYGLDDEDDWHDPRNFIKANPNMNVTVSEAWLKKMLLEAEQNPKLEAEFRCKNLCQWLNRQTAWIKPQVWEKVMKKEEPDLTKPYYAVGAIDLSKRRDLTCFSWCVYQNKKFYMKHRFFFPKDAMAEKLANSSEMWMKWSELGYLIPTPGDAINYEYMYKTVREVMGEVRLECLLYDNYNASNLINEFDGEIDLVEVPQNIKRLSPFTKSYEETIYSQTLVDPNPVIQWMMLNAEVYVDQNDNLKICKPKKDTDKKVDGLITSAMCVGYIRGLEDQGELNLEVNVEELHDFLTNLNI